MSWTLQPQGLAAGPLHVSFQRFVRPASGRVAAAPSSLGALPVAACGAAFLLPVAAGEAFWIGLSVTPGAAVRLLITAERRDGTSMPLAPVLVPPSRGVAGVPAGPQFAVFDAELAALILHGSTAARIEIADPATFAARTGVAAPAPPDPAAAYGGWRLPGCQRPGRPML